MDEDDEGNEGDEEEDQLASLEKVEVDAGDVDGIFGGLAKACGGAMPADAETTQRLGTVAASLKRGLGALEMLTEVGTSQLTLLSS